LQKQYFEKFEENNLTYEIIKKYFHEDILRIFINQQLKLMSYIPKDAIIYMNDYNKLFFQTYIISYSDIEIYNGKFDETTTEAPIQNAQVSIISTKSFLDTPIELLNSYINLIKNTLLNNNNQLFFLGTPILFNYNNNLYILTKHIKDLSDNHYDLIDGEKFTIIKEKFIKSDNGEIFYKNTKPIKLQEFIEKQVGSKSYIIKDNDYDSINILEGGNIAKSSKVLSKFFS